MRGVARAAVFSWLLATIGVAVAAELSNPYVTAGVVGTFWVLLVREWRSADRSHHLDPLTLLYLFAGVSLLLWSIAWETLGPWSVLGVLVIAPAAMGVMIAVAHFEATGYLPRRLARPLRIVLGTLERSRAQIRLRLLWRFLFRDFKPPFAAESASSRLTLTSADDAECPDALTLEYSALRRGWVVTRKRKETPGSVVALERPGDLDGADEVQQFLGEVVPRGSVAQPVLERLDLEQGR